MLGCEITLASGQKVPGALFEDGQIYAHEPLADTWGCVADLMQEDSVTGFQIVGPVVPVEEVKDDLSRSHTRNMKAITDICNEQSKIQMKLYREAMRDIDSFLDQHMPVVACGRRYGKTLLACNEIVAFALEHPNASCAWVAPWYKQSKIAYRLIRRAFAKSGNDIICHKSDSELRLEFVNGSVIQFFSAENYDGMRGNGFHFIVIDEAGDALKSPEMWSEAIRPALSDTNGKAVIIGTPKGRNQFFQFFARGDDPEYAEWASFHAPTADNPSISFMNKIQEEEKAA